jgi:hypothetical protein
MMPKPNTQRASSLLASVTADMIAPGTTFEPVDGSLRVEKIILELVRPHPVQPRRVLPESIHQAFHQERLTPSQALRELIQLVQVAARQRSHPFTNVLELLTDSEAEEADKPLELSPEETLLRDLVNLAVTIRDDGQVNPLTVVDVSEGVSRLYRIETGERRYWATWLLRDFIPNSGSDGTLPAIIIPPKTASVFRQAKENTSRSGLTAIAMARQAALLLLSVHSFEIPTYPVNNDYYRQALELDLLTKREYTEAILSAMGGISRMHLSHYKNLLRLSDEALELADRYGVEERKLRYVVQLSPELHFEILRQIVDFKLTSKQVKDLCTTDKGEDDPDEDENKTSAKAIKFAKLMRTETSPKEIAQALLAQENNIEVAKARINTMRNVLTAVEKLILEGEL